MRATEEQLQLIKKVTRGIVDDNNLEVYSFKAIGNKPICDTFMMSDAVLKQFEQQAKEGIPLMLNHAWKKQDGKAYVYGRSFDARLIKGEEEDETAALEIFFYIPHDVNMGEMNTNDIINSINAGLMIDVSVGFSYDKTSCSICGKTKCEHSLGEVYNGKKCYRKIDNGKLFELSLVFSPAYKGAGLKSFGNGDDKKLMEELNKEYKVKTGKNYACLSALVGFDIEEKSEERRDDMQKGKNKDNETVEETKTEEAKTVEETEETEVAEEKAVSDVGSPDGQPLGILSIDGEEVSYDSVVKFYTLGKKMFYEKVEEAKKEAVRAIPDINLTALELAFNDADYETLNQKIVGYKAMQLDIPTGRKTKEVPEIKVTSNDDFKIRG